MNIYEIAQAKHCREKQVVNTVEKTVVNTVDVKASC